MPRTAYLGPPGSFAHQAVLTVPGAGELVPSRSVLHALASVRAAEVDAALVPFENSIEGGVAGTLDGLADLSLPPLQITDEVLLPVQFALLTRPGTGLSQVHTVATHPHAEAQCRGWLVAHLPGAEVVLSASTSTAARDVAEGRYDAAVASPAAADVYAVTALATDIADSAGAVTRFVLVGTPRPPAAPTGADRSTVVLFEGEDHPGTLLEMLTEFAVRGVNLTRLESRPTGAGLGRYSFSLDCDGHVADARVGETLSALRRVCADIRFLGSYPKASAAPTAPRRGTSDEDFAASARWLDGLRRGDHGS